MGNSTTLRTQVTVIGAGAVGAAIARELVQQGHDVVVIDRNRDWGQSASLGNAGYICASHAGPWATRRELRQAIAWLAKRNSPLSMNPTPSMAPFFLRLLTGSDESVENAYVVNRAMMLRSIELHREIVASGIDTGFQTKGLLDVYESPGRFEDARKIAEAQTAGGVRAIPLSQSEVRELEPSLTSPIVGGVFYPDDAHCDPKLFTRAVGQDAVDRGARVLFETDVIGIQRAGNGVKTVTSTGEILSDRVVVAAGARSSALARRSFPYLQAGRGFSFELEHGSEVMPKRPTMLQEQRLALSPLSGRLRIAGMMQFAGLDERIDKGRLKVMERGLKQAMPSWENATRRSEWAGLRPCTPDGLPLIGWANDRVMIATGHAMLGLALALETGERVRRMFDGEKVEDSALLDPARFRSRS